MQYVDNSARIAVKSNDVFDTKGVMELLTSIDEKMKKFGVEVFVNVDSDGTHFIDVQKKRVTRTRRKRTDLLG